MNASDSLALLDADRILALSYVSQALRPGVRTLWELDATFAAVLRAGGDPMLRRIKLAWWREALERLDHEAAPAQPLLAALQEHVIPRGISGARLAAMEGAWSLLLEEGALGEPELAAYAAGRGGRLFTATAQLLGGDPPPGVDAAGQSWALVDLARHSGRGEEAAAALAAAAGHVDAVSLHWPVRLRPLGMLPTLAARDARSPGTWERLGSPRRMFRMLRYRVTGR